MLLDRSLIDPALFNMDLQNSAALFYENGKRRYCASRKFFSSIPKKQTDEKWLNYYYESETAQSVENTIQSLVRLYHLKRKVLILIRFMVPNNSFMNFLDRTNRRPMLALTLYRFLCII